jgi:lipopolysaccharide export system permease protein
VSTVPTVTVRVDSIDYNTEELWGVTLFRSTRGVYQDVIVAEAGRFIANADSGRMTLMLENGEIHHFDPNQPNRYVRNDYRRFFQNFTVDLRLDTEYKTSRNDRTKSVEMLENDIAQYEATNKGLQTELNRLPATLADRVAQVTRIKNDIISNKRQIFSLLVEVHKKYAIPFACIVFVLLGSSLGILARRSGASMGIGLSIGFFTLYYMSLIGGESAGDRMLISPWIGMWASNIVLGALGIYMIIYAARK